MSVSSHALAGASTAPAEDHSVSRTGLGNEWFGMVLFLASEAIMFGAIFAQYFYLRVLSPEWPPAAMARVPAAPLPLILTLLLAVSGFTAHFAQTAIRKGNHDAVQGWLGLTILLGLLFLGGQVFEYAELIGHGFTIASGVYGSVFYVLTGLHGLHVTGGVVLLIAMLVRSALGHFSPANHFALEGTILYWHFVDIVWFALYASLYLL